MPPRHEMWRGNTKEADQLIRSGSSSSVPSFLFLDIFSGVNWRVPLRNGKGNENGGKGISWIRTWWEGNGTREVKLKVKMKDGA